MSKNQDRVRYKNLVAVIFLIGASVAVGGVIFSALVKIAPVVIAGVAVWNILTVKRFQESSFRPIVTAYVKNIKRVGNYGKEDGFLTLILKNSGQLPATNIRIVTLQEDISQYFWNQAYHGDQARKAQGHLEQKIHLRQFRM
jgi:hypothetical protein